MGLVVFNTMDCRSDIVDFQAKMWLDAIAAGDCLRRDPLDPAHPERGEWRLVAYCRPDDHLDSHAVGAWGEDCYVEDILSSPETAEAYYESLVEGTCAQFWFQHLHTRMQHRTSAYPTELLGS